MSVGAPGVRAPVDDWAGYPSYARLREPGHYAYVIDRPGVHEVVVFRAVWLSTAGRS